jgi:2-polyprenyl-3-methyl-5-hydroxy-6-metoxy-1,4-benzoquinol methylase
MNFYSSIAQNYDHIFPVKQAQIDFVRSEFSSKIKLIEVGSGTGNLTIALANTGYLMSGLEYDENMLDLAQGKSNDVSWKCGDMRGIDRDYHGEIFDGIICFGNTLVHLSDAKDIEGFLKKAYDLLNDGGIIAIQIINYSRIFSQKIDHLPTIENDKIQFVRNYKITRKPRNVQFKTELTIKETNEIIENKIGLFPIFPDELYKMMQKIGFSNIQQFSDFSKGDFTADSTPFIITGQK